MEIDRPNRTSYLFICFNSQFSNSSSMCLSSKSFLNLHCSLRRGAQSPSMFPESTKKNRGSSLFTENPEPTSPKVTCIGQVRVKTKKHGKKMKMLASRSKRTRSNGGDNGGYGDGEPSFRRKQCGSLGEGVVVKNDDKHRNQRWVHLPWMVCETLKGLGSCCTYSCFRSWSSESNINRGNGGKESGNCCGVFRWMVSLEGGGKKDIELVVGGVDEEIRGRECSKRRSILDDVEFDDLFTNVGISVNDNNDDNDSDDDDGFDGRRGEECGGRVSVCVPPKNALLLMRCRSDPMRMASISQKFWDPNLVQEDSVEEVVVIKEENEVEDDEKIVVREAEMIDIKEEIVELGNVGEEIDELCDDFEGICRKNEDLQVFSEEKTEGKQNIGNSIKEEVLENAKETQLMEGLNVADECLIETTAVEKGENGHDLDGMLEGEEMDVEEESCVLSTYCTISEVSAAAEEPKQEKEEEKVKVKGEEARQSTEMENNKPMLPDCLLLMMCEPKLSMEVSKETWVCKTDFIRYLPERHLNKKSNKINDSNDRSSNVSKRSKPPLPPAAGQGGRTGIQPGRSSISFPTSGVSVANLIEQKLAEAGVGHEPFVLTRCNSAPLRSTSKHEQHRPATCGVGAGRVGF